ncbi:O-antigen ligase family protein [bacterium]|nr:O-antigen ligase family protein [bacterium]
MSADTLLSGRNLGGRRWPLDPRQAVLLFCLLVVFQVGVSVLAASQPLAFVAGVLFLFALVLSFRSTLTGLALIILSQLYVLKGTAEISAGELAYAALFVSTLLGWVLREGVAAEGRRLLRSPAGASLLAFFALCVGSIVFVAFHGGSPLWWLRDLVRFSYLLLFFPIAGTVRSRRDAGIMLACLLAVILYHGTLTITWYAQAVASTEAIWQLRYQRVALHEIFAMTTLVASFAVFLRTRTRAISVAVIATGLIGLIALGVSFTRGYWLATVLACVIVAVMMRGPARRVVAFSLILLVAVVSGGVAVFSAKFLGILISMADRLSTFSNPLRVLSVQERMAETQAVLRMIWANPVFGRGLGAHVSYMSPLKHHVITRSFLHNAYLFIWFKLGFVGLASFLVFYFRGLRMTVRAAARADTPVVRALFVSGVAVLVAAVPLSFTSPQFYDKSSALVLALILGLAHAALHGKLERGGVGIGRPARGDTDGS